LIVSTTCEISSSVFPFVTSPHESASVSLDDGHGTASVKSAIAESD